MPQTSAPAKLKFLEDKWDDSFAATLDAPELLRYRSNLLGSDLRLTNFGGGNTSSKLETVDPVDGQKKLVLWVKGSGGDLGSIKRAGFATLYLDKLLALEKQYRGVDEEDAMVELYPLVTFGNNPTAASIDTPLHGFLPFAHVDHLHPDWAIALAASANGKQRMEEFNTEFGHKLAWLPWQRPGFELGMMLRKIVSETPGCDGVVLGGLTAVAQRHEPASELGHRRTEPLMHRSQRGIPHSRGHQPDPSGTGYGRNHGDSYP